MELWGFEAWLDREGPDVGEEGIDDGLADKMPLGPREKSDIVLVIKGKPPSEKSEEYFVVDLIHIYTHTSSIVNYINTPPPLQTRVKGNKATIEHPGNAHGSHAFTTSK